MTFKDIYSLSRNFKHKGSNRHSEINPYDELGVATWVQTTARALAKLEQEIGGHQDLKDRLNASKQQYVELCTNINNAGDRQIEAFEDQFKTIIDDAIRRINQQPAPPEPLG